MESSNRGQSSIELTVVLIVIMVLLVGAAKLFTWLNARMVRQQVEYDNTRVAAGNADRSASAAVAVQPLDGVAESGLTLPGENIVDDSSYPELNIFNGS